MTQKVPWKVRFDTHVFMLNGPISSIELGRKFGIAALIVIGIVCAVRATLGLPVSTPAPRPASDAVSAPTPLPGSPKTPRIQPSHARPPQ